MSVFHAVSAFCNAGFDLLGTNASLTTAAREPFLNMVLMALIICGGLGFLVWDDLLTHRLRFRRWRLHSKIALTGTLALFVLSAIAFYIVEGDHAFAGASEAQKALMAAFQSVTARTAGFCTVDPTALSQGGTLLTLLLMFVGAGSGSTGGGVKVMRLVMLFRLAYLEIFRLLHPHSVRHLKIAGKSVPVEVISGVVGFFLLYLIVTTVGTIVLTVQDMDLVSAFTATLTCISNVGPGLGSVGPVDNFSHVPTLSKWVLTLCMLLGRLEIYAILVLFIPEFWRD